MAFSPDEAAQMNEDTEQFVDMLEFLINTHLQVHWHAGMREIGWSIKPEQYSKMLSQSPSSPNHLCMKKVKHIIETRYAKHWNQVRIDIKDIDATQFSFSVFLSPAERG